MGKPHEQLEAWKIAMQLVLCQIAFKTVIPAGIAGIQVPWMGSGSPSMALDTRFPAGTTRLRKSDKVECDITAGFPVEELYGLAQQMRRAAVSIPSNIAEGAGRNGVKEYLHFIGISRGSLAELETQMQIAVMLGFIVIAPQISAPQFPLLLERVRVRRFKSRNLMCKRYTAANHPAFELADHTGKLLTGL